MKNTIIIAIALMVAVPFMAKAEELKLNDNDKGLLCVGLSKADCAETKYRLSSAGGDNSGYFSFELQYRQGQYLCQSEVTKRFSEKNGWVTTGAKTGQNCQELSDEEKSKFDVQLNLQPMDREEVTAVE